MTHTDRSAGQLAHPAFGPEPFAARAIVEPFAPVSWAYLRLDRPGVEDRATRVRALIAQLRRAGSSEAAATAVADQLVHAPVAPGVLAVFAADDGLLLHVRPIDTSQEDQAGCSMPADIVTLLDDDQRHPPYVCVVVDRAGADITYSEGADAADQLATVTGPDDEIRHTAAGGWAGLSQSRFQRRASDSWQHNAQRVAERVADCAAAAGAQAVLVAGEARAAGMVRERLSLATGVVVREMPGSRASDRKYVVHREHLRAALHDVAAWQTARLLDLLADHAEDDLAVYDAEATVHALAAGRVATLLVGDGLAEHRIWVGARPTDVHVDQREAAMSIGPVRSVPLVHAAIRAALLSGARVRIVPTDGDAAPGFGIAALCRYGTAR
jgi:hypothetical protein